MKILSPDHFTEYELIDSGGYEKLERFGKIVLRRPEPQALWDKSLDEKTVWQKCDARFIREKSGKTETGGWTFFNKIADHWFVNYEYKSLKIRLKLMLTSFGHVGIFPEQAENWNYITEACLRHPSENPKVLNLFAYTGGASLAAKAGGADITHLDSVKNVVNWANENMQNSGLDGIRWLVEDALKFVRREERRGRFYDGIIADPPAYGRGPTGEKWVLEEQINELVSLLGRILKPEKRFFVLNLYSMGLSGLVADTLVRSRFPGTEPEFGELCLKDQSGKRLPLGTFLRFSDY